MPKLHMREVLREPHFAEQLEKIKDKEPRIDEFVDGCDTLLSRAPEQGTKISEDVWAVPIHRPPWMKQGWIIYYTFNENQTYLLAIGRASKEEL